MPPLSSISVCQPLPCTLNSFTVTPAWCQHIIARWDIDGPAARKFPSAQWEVNAVRESSAVTPPRPARWHRYASHRLPWRGCAGLPGAEPVCLRNKGQSQRASGAELCESLLKRSLWWISFTASWNSSLSWEAHVWRKLKHQKKKDKEK